QRRDVLELLKSAKIDLDKQLSINSMGTTSRRASNGNYETVPTQSFTLRLFSTQQLQLISSALEKKGIKSQRVNIDTSKRDEYERQVRILAMQDAREQAQILAEAVGCKAGQCVKIIDPSNRTALKSHGANMNASRVAYSEFAEESELTASPNLKYEKIEISYSVEAEFMLESGK
ncbi:MAG: SIMPL domain-containing protein, partial [Alistipes sp.]|nr:SIMPL domain-containing protein [Alistipes sp.]